MVCDTLASCVRTLFNRGMIRWHNALWLGMQGTSPFVNVSKCWSEWSSKGLERKRSRVLDCLCAWAAWVCGAMALPHSFLLPFSLFLFSLFLFFLFCYLSPFFLSFPLFSPLFFFELARPDTFLKQGYSFGWLELAARRSVISPTLGLLCESQVCNVGVSFRVCSNSEEHQSVQLMQTSCSRASYVPRSS